MSGEDALRRAEAERRRRAIHEREEREFSRTRAAEEVEKQRRQEAEKQRAFKDEKEAGHIYRFVNPSLKSARRSDSAEYFARLDRERKERESAEAEERRKQAVIDAEHAAAMARIAAEEAKAELARRRALQRGSARPWRSVST